MWCRSQHLLHYGWDAWTLIIHQIPERTDYLRADDKTHIYYYVTIVFHFSLIPMNRTWKIKTEEIKCDNRTKIIFARFTAMPVSLNTAVAACWRFSLLLFFLSEYEQLQSLATAVITLSMCCALRYTCFSQQNDSSFFTTDYYYL